MDDLVQGVLAGHRATLARAITLVESKAPKHRPLVAELMERIAPHTGGAHRIGLSGVPGVGKSSFLETLGLRLANADQQVAVLAIDPTSSVRGGSILGDKTRMQGLAKHPNAFVRPSPSGGTLGGVHRSTREALLLCEAAGFDVVFVETVGVGQSETTVAQLVDVFLVLMLANAGDELQGIKKGILEVADVLCVHKADGDRVPDARRARREYASALRLVRPSHPRWTVPVLMASSLTGEGLDGVWETLQRHRREMTADGSFVARREAQRGYWFEAAVRHALVEAFEAAPQVAARLPGLRRAVASGERMPHGAADELVAAFLRGPSIPD